MLSRLVELAGILGGGVLGVAMVACAALRWPSAVRWLIRRAGLIAVVIPLHRDRWVVQVRSPEGTAARVTGPPAEATMRAVHAVADPPDQPPA